MTERRPRQFSLRYTTVIAGVLLSFTSCASRTASRSQGELTDFATRYATAWSSQDPAELAEFYAENGSLTVNAGAPSVGRAAITATAREYMTAFPDMVVRLDSLRREGDHPIFHWTWTGTNTGPGGTGKRVHLSGYEQWTIGVDGLISESKGHYDEEEYERQLSEPAIPPGARTGPASGMAPVNDIQMYYEIHGDGTPLILLHGGLGSTVNWRNQIPVLSRQYRVIAVDSRGHGRSTFTEQRISYALMASDIIALMDYLGIEKAHILGWSDGGIIALDLAINHPDRLNKVIAFGANYNPSGLRTDIGENEKIDDFMEKAANDYQTLSPDPTRWDEFLENIGQMWASEPNFTAEELGSITVPVLILDGDSDEAIYIEHTKEMAGLIPTARLTLIPGTGHFAMWEKPDEINEVILEFLAQ
jgi:pimeloyl-ACP methyl ester carboxylesterase